MNKKNIGSDFNDFLRDEGIYDGIHAAALMVMVQAAHAVGLEMGLRFKKARNTRPRRTFARALGNAGANADARVRPAGERRPAHRSSRSPGPAARAGARARPRR